jgi:hypothetical protein
MALAINIGYGLYKGLRGQGLKNGLKRLFWADTLTVSTLNQITVGSKQCQIG